MFSREPSFKSPAATFGKIALSIGIGLSALGIILFLILFTNIDRLAGIIVLSTVGGMGVVWLIVGLIFAGINSRANAKLDFLRETGQHYEAEEIYLIPTNAVMVNNNPAVHAECIYTNNFGQRCRVVSRMFMWNRWGQEAALRATIYVDRQDPSLYAVEMMYLAGADGVDIDYSQNRF